MKKPGKSQSSSDPLIIKSLEFLGPMATHDGWRPSSDLPEVAFAGRSNVGKSSLLNRLLRRRAFARVSNTPGRTREINFFQVNDRFVLADLPGYGYARISKARKAEWQPLIEGYLRNSPSLRGVVLLLDVRHHPTEDDRTMLDFLSEVGVPTILAATKIDKIKRAEVLKRCGELALSLGLVTEQIVPFSAKTGDGRDELARAVEIVLDQPDWRQTVEAESPSVEGELDR